MMEAPPPAIAVVGLTAGYGARAVLHGVDLAVPSGKAVCLVGPNGSGKSTVLRALYGLADIRAGQVRIAERDVTALPADQRLGATGMAFVPQESSVFPDLTVAENLLLGGHVMASRRRVRQRAEQLLTAYPVLARLAFRRAGTLSGGERRLLEIVRALMTDPAILLADEPSIGLSPAATEAVFDLFGALRAQGKTILLVEQNTQAGLGFADIGYVLIAGQVARVGDARALLADPSMAGLLLGAPD